MKPQPINTAPINRRILLIWTRLPNPHIKFHIEDGIICEYVPDDKDDLHPPPVYVTNEGVWFVPFDSSEEESFDYDPDQWCELPELSVQYQETVE